MRTFVAVTDNDWFTLHASLDRVDEVNFWRPPSDATFKALQPGELLLFKLHAPLTMLSVVVSSFRFLQLPVNLAWDRACIENGMSRFVRLLDRLLDAPGAQWQKTKWRPSGYRSDLRLESRIEFILEAASLEESEDLARLVSSGCAKLVAKMQTEINFHRTIRLLNIIKSNKWFTASLCAWIADI